MTKNNFKQLKVNDRFTGPVPLEFSSKKDTEIPDVIHLVPIGQWDHDLYGPIIINNSDIREFIQNFNANIRKGVYITAGHEGFEELPAVGWVKSLESRVDGLWGEIEWNELGMEVLKDKQFKFFSPELCRDYEDPQTHQFYRNVLTGGALTKSPYFKELNAIVFSDKNINNNKTNNMSKTLEEVLKLEVTALTDEDKAVLKENADKLTDEQKVQYKDIVEVKTDDNEPEPETDEEKQAREEKEKGDANEAAGLNRDGSPRETEKKETDTIQAAEKVMVSKQEYADLKVKLQAFEKKEIESEVAKHIFSENNKGGQFLPKAKDKLQAFAEKLGSQELRVEMFSLLESLVPRSEIFKENGDGGDDGSKAMTALKEVENRVTKFMSENKTMTYADALKKVFAEDKDLQTRYNSEVNSN